MMSHEQISKRMWDERAIEWPDGDKTEAHDVVGSLEKTLCGLRGAALKFQHAVSTFMSSQGFTMGTCNSTTYMHRIRNINVMKYGDGVRTQ